MEINRHNYKEVLMLMLDDELSPAEKIQVEAYMLLHEEAGEEWKALQKTKLKPQKAPVYPRMAMLLKDEEDAPVIAKSPAATVSETSKTNNSFGKRIMYWSAAASVLAAIIFFTLNKPVENFTAAVTNTVEQPSHEKTHINSTEKMLAADENLHISNTEKMLQIDGENKLVKQETSKPKVFSSDAIYAKTGSGVKTETVSEENRLMAQIEMPVTNAENFDKSKTRLVRKVNRLMAASLKANWDAELQHNTMAYENEEPGLAPSLINFFSRTLHVEKKTIDEEKFYAVTLETQNVHISRTFKSNF